MCQRMNTNKKQMQKIFDKLFESDGTNLFLQWAHTPQTTRKQTNQQNAFQYEFNRDRYWAFNLTGIYTGGLEYVVMRVGCTF